jgi:hypothetical protein
VTARLAIVAVMLGASAIACGGDGGGGVDAEADQEAAEAAIAAFEAELAERDFEPQTDDDDDDSDVEFQTEECEQYDEAFGEDEDLPDETASAESGDFERGELDLEGGTQELASGSVGFTEDSEALEEYFDLLADDLFGQCVVEAIESEFAADADAQTSVGQFDVDTDDLGVGDESISLQLGTTIEAEGFTLPVAFEFALARSDRTAAFVFLGAVGADEINEDAAELLTLLFDEAGVTA